MLLLVSRGVVVGFEGGGGHVVDATVPPLVVVADDADVVWVPLNRDDGT